MSKVRVLREEVQDAFELAKVELRGACIQDVARESGVSYTTLQNWRRGKVQSPQFYKLVAVLAALGYRVVVKRRL